MLRIFTTATHRSDRYFLGFVLYGMGKEVCCSNFHGGEVCLIDYYWTTIGNI